MRTNRNRRKSTLLMALLLVATILLGSIGSTERVQAAAKGDYYLKVNKGTNVVTVYKNDGTPYTAFTCSTGYATPTGTFYTPAKYRWWTLDGPSYGQYCTRITRGFLFHSVWYYQQAKNAQSYTQYNKLGTTASHGCCRLTVAAAKWIYDNCPTGTKVIIFNGKAKDDPLGKPKTIKVKGYRGWDPTDPDKNNPYKTKSTKPVISVSKKVLEYGSTFGNGNMTCKDSGGFDITDWVQMTGSVNTKKIGTYPVTYTVIDSFGRTATKKVTYKVVDTNPVTLTGVEKSLTMDVGATMNMRSGLKAVDAAGVNLTSKIGVYIKTPSSDEYERFTGKNYTFEESGTYRVKYIVKNPNNGRKISKSQTITVRVAELPTLSSVYNWNDIIPQEDQRELYWEGLMSDVTAELSDGTDVTNLVEIVVTTPSGEKVTLKETESYIFREKGTYQLLYRVTNPNVQTGNNTAEMTRKLIYKTQMQAEVVLNE